MDYENKKSQLELLEYLKQALEGDTKLYEETQQEGWTSRLIEGVINNLHLSISNVHVRLESDKPYTSVGGTKFKRCTGVVLSSASIYSTSAVWERKYVANPGEMLYKVASIDGFSVYHETEADDVPLENDVVMEQYLNNMVRIHA